MLQRILLALSLTPALLFGACATNALGRPPSDVDLTNDGSPQQQSTLLQRYSIVYDRGLIRRPGVTPGQVATEVNHDVNEVAAEASSDDAENYLSSSEPATEVLDNPAVALDQFTHSGQGELILVATGAGVGFASGVISGVVASGAQNVNPMDVAWTGFGGMISGVILGGLVGMVYEYVAPAISTPLAAPVYRRAVKSFNKDLRARVREGAAVGDAPTPPEAAPPEPEPAPAPVEGESTPATEAPAPSGG